MTLSSWGDERRVLTIALVVRIASVFFVQTNFVPDEYWQSVEVAHHSAFGYGHLTWEWDESAALRGPGFVWVFAAIFRGLAALGLDSAGAIVAAPRVCMALLAALGDVAVYRLALRTFGDRSTARYAALFTLTAWFNWFAASRTLLNSLETSLNAVAMAHWSFGGEVDRSAERPRLALAIAALACVLRPTAAISWVYLGLARLATQGGRARFLCTEVLPTACAALAACALIDRARYGVWTLTPLNFLRFNVLQRGNEFFGLHAWHWYASQGLPTIGATLVPLAALGLARARGAGRRVLGGAALWLVAVCSLQGHKEFRFIMPVMPALCVYAAHCAATLATRPALRAGVVATLLATQLGAAAYFGTVHQRGALDAIKDIARLAKGGDVQSVHFWMPCHSTPLYSHVHAPIELRFFDCSPPPYAAARGAQQHEDAAFFADPRRALEEMYVERRWQWAEQRRGVAFPSHVLLFEHLAEDPAVRSFLAAHGYAVARSYFHVHFPVDDRARGRVLLYARGGGAADMGERHQEL
jgi:phosphatidylinositol glycan class B